MSKSYISQCRNCEDYNWNTCKCDFSEKREELYPEKFRVIGSIIIASLTTMFVTALGALTSLEEMLLCSVVLATISYTVLSVLNKRG